jgi:uncharacterized DUF497 family protein
MRIDGFNWDDGNWPKCASHGVSKSEIESIFKGGRVSIIPSKEGLSSEARSAAIGLTSEGRYVFIVFTIREHEALSLIRPISARFMHQKEIKHYERQAGSQVLP